MKPHRLLSLLLLPALLPLFTSCTDTLLETPAAGNANADIPEGYYFILDTDVPQNAPQTRVAYADINHSYFEEDDRLGIYVIDSDGNRITDAPANAQYKVTNVTNIATGTVRQVLENVGTDVPRGEGYRYVIYYPYDPDMTFDRLKDLTHSVQTDQHADPASTTSLTPYEQSDLLWDVVSEDHTSNGTPYVEIRMDHAMANIILNIDEKYVQAGSSEEGYSVYIVNSPATASGINLTQGLETEGWRYNVPTSDPNNPTEFTPIRMWYTGYGTSGELQFRAVIPACQTISNNGSAFFRITDPSRTPKEYKLTAPLPVKPGKNYIFNIRESGGTEQPELSDDNSWVLDVLDPETGRPIGLLCREYVRYQQDNSTDQHTGTDKNNGSKWINSQAWVFYNLQDDGETPNLNQGTILRFIYDIEEIGHGATPVNGTAQANIWPAPHYKMTSGGLFTPLHGYKWGTMYANGYGGEYTGMGTAQDGYDEPIEAQYYMHGGVITWDGTNNKIANFTLPDAKITNNEALQGYIAIEDGQRPYIAYQEKEGVRKGIIVEHFLIDTRRTDLNTRQTEIKRYPLVKIGYNQFWMSKPLDTEYMTDGTPIPCYNSTSGPGVTFSLDVNSGIGLGYLYCFVNNDLNNPDITYDPYNNDADRPDPTKTSFTPGKYYNFNTVEDVRFLPISPESNTFYTMPDRNDITYLGSYFGPWFAAKISSRDIGPYQKANEGAGSIELLTGYTRKQSIIEGKTCGLTTRPANVFCANISGFNLHSVGFYDVGHDEKGLSFRLVGESSCIILKRETGESRVTMMDYRVYDTFNEDNPVNDESLIFHEYNHNNFVEYAPLRPSKVFGQVRLFMKYRNQADTGGVSITTSTRSVSGSAPAESRNVYIPIQAID